MRWLRNEQPGHIKLPNWEAWEAEMERVAWSILHGREPEFTVDGRGNFYTADGRFVLGPESVNFHARAAEIDLRLEQLEASREDRWERIRVAEDRWKRFLASDGEAAELLAMLQERAGSAKVSYGYELPSEKMADEESGPEGERMSPFGGPEEKEAVRRLTWTLTHETESLATFSELTRRRDRFVAAGPS